MRQLVDGEDAKRNRSTGTRPALVISRAALRSFDRACNAVAAATTTSSVAAVNVEAYKSAPKASMPPEHTNDSVDKELVHTTCTHAHAFRCTVGSGYRRNFGNNDATSNNRPLRLVMVTAAADDEEEADDDDDAAAAAAAAKYVSM